MSAPLSPETLRKIEDCLFAGQKVAAVKLYRDATESGLAEAKSAVDATELNLRAEFPNKFTMVAVPWPMNLLLMLCGISMMTLGGMKIWATHTGDVAAQGRYQHALSLSLLLMCCVSMCIHSLTPKRRWLVILLFFATVFLYVALAFRDLK